MKLPENTRVFRPGDLGWIKPIAEKYGEWNEVLDALSRRVTSMVVPELAILVMHTDEHGLCLSALTDDGIKALLPMIRAAVDSCKRLGMPFHGHYVPGTWQANLAVKHGLYNDGEKYVFKPSEAKRCVSAAAVKTKTKKVA